MLDFFCFVSVFMMFLVVFHVGYKPRKNAKKGANLSRIMKSWSQGRDSSLQQKNYALQQLYSGQKSGKGHVFLLQQDSVLLQSKNTGLTVLRAETLTLKEKKKPLLIRGRLELILEREKQQKTPISLRILTKIEGKKAKIPSFT